MEKIDLMEYGLDSNWIEEAIGFQDYFIGRIISQSRNIYHVIHEKGELLAEISGKMNYEARRAQDYPAVGDFCLLDRETDENGNGIIQRILSRKSLFIRKSPGNCFKEQVVASNIDTLFICMSLNQNFNIRRLERYIVLAWESGATPVVVLTKADLCKDIEMRVNAAMAVSQGAEVLITSVIEEGGCEEILPYIKEGHTVALIGSSGVGKSTLINCLLGEQKLAIGETGRDDKGRHVTTRRELIKLPQGGILIDTPGMREIGMWNISESLEKAFDDVEKYFGKCKFRNCTHSCEQGCAIYAAIKNGELSEERWQSYQKLKIEDAYIEDRVEYMEHKKEKFKNIAKYNKRIKREN